MAAAEAVVVVVVVEVGGAFTLSSVAYGSADQKAERDQQAADALQRAHPRLYVKGSFTALLSVNAPYLYHHQDHHNFCGRHCG